MAEHRVKTNAVEEVEVARLLDVALKKVAIDFGSTYVMVSRFPNQWWQLTCLKELSEIPVKFSCSVIAPSVRVKFFQTTAVS